MTANPMPQRGFIKPETDTALSVNTDSFLPIWSGIGYSSEIFFFFPGGRRASLPFALKQTAKWFGVRKKKPEHLILF